MAPSEITRELAEETVAVAHKAVQGGDGDGDAASAKFLSIASAARYLRGYGHDARKAGRNLAATYDYFRELGLATLGHDADSAKLIWTELKRRNMFIGSYDDDDNGGNDGGDDGDTSDARHDKKSPIVVIRKRSAAFDMAEFDDFRKSFVFVLHCTAVMADRQERRGVTEDDIDGQVGQWVIIMDMKSFEKANSPPFSVTVETMRIFQRHFPERAKTIIIVDAPGAFNLIWRVVSPLIDSVTRKKFVFVSRADGEEELIKQLGPTVVKVINMDLDEGKRTGAKLMVEHGLLLDGYGEL